MIINKKINLSKSLYELVYYLYIIVAPINNLLNDNGANAMVAYLSVLLVLIGCTYELLIEKRIGGYNSYVVALALGIEVLIQYCLGNPFELNWIAMILVFCMILTIPKAFSLKRIYMAFYISSIVSAVCSISYGMRSGAVERTAIWVDGSLAVIVIAIVLFAKENFEKTRVYNGLKCAALISCFIIAVFGMSRSRLLIIGVLLLIWLLFAGKAMFMTGRPKIAPIFLSILVVFAIVFVARLDITQNLYDSIVERFDGGLESVGRDNEVAFGIELFKQNWLIGAGWGKISYHNHNLDVYYNHNMYVAILARGGVFFTATMLCCFGQILRATAKSKNFLCMMLLFIFLLLGYGNAGIFNYTICSLFIPLVLQLKDETIKITF